MSDYSPSQYAPPRGLSIASLIIGLASLVFGFTFFVPIVGLVLGILGIKREPAGRGFAIAGIWINAVIVAFWAVIIVLLIAGAVGFGIFSIPFLWN